MPVFPIRESIAATPRAHIIRLDLQGQSFPYLAGQAAYLQPEGAEKRRPYSIASAPEQTAQNGRIEFLVQTGMEGSSGFAEKFVAAGPKAAHEADPVEEIVEVPGQLRPRPALRFGGLDR